MKVTLNIPDAEWWALAKIAEAEGVRIGALVHEALRNVAAERRVDLERIDRLRREREALPGRVVALVGEGLPDRVIAERLGVDVQRVYSVRKAAGLKPNPLGSRATGKRVPAVGRG